MKLSQYAKKAGISYKTAWRWYKAGTLDAYQTPTGMVVVRDPHMERPPTGRMALYICVNYRRLNPHELPDLLLGAPILVPQVLQKHFLADVQVMFTQIFIETDAVNMGHTRNQQAVRVVDCTFAHLVLQSYVADYINVPCLACQ